jgi:hypothetical protein
MTSLLNRCPKSQDRYDEESLKCRGFYSKFGTYGNGHCSTCDRNHCCYCSRKLPENSRRLGHSECDDCIPERCVNCNLDLTIFGNTDRAIDDNVYFYTRCIGCNTCYPIEDDIKDPGHI